MSVLIGAARQDERGKDYGGQIGDQTGHEVEAYPWTDRPGDGWNVLRYKDPEKRKKAVELAWQIINNPLVGYSQYLHGSLEKRAKEKGWRFDLIEQGCDTDCCDMQRTIAHALGVNVGSCYTATQEKVFMATGAFDLLTGPQYAHTDQYLMAGDIGCMPPGVQGHTWIALEDGPLAKADVDLLFVVDANCIRQRSTPEIRDDNTVQFIPRNATFCAESFKLVDDTLWAFGEYKGIQGFCSMKYLTPCQAFPELYTDGQTWLRKGPGTKYDGIVVIPRYQTFYGTGNAQPASDGRIWYEAIYNSLEGWVSSRYLTVKF